MKVPMLHRSTQMALLKKQIQRKANEVRQRKRHARRRLELMRRIRDQLLNRMRVSIDVRQRDTEQNRRERARRAVGSMLAMYKNWLRNCSRSLRKQNQLIHQQELVKKRLDQRLHRLRKQLKTHQSPKHIVDNCFRRLAKAMRKWQNSSDYHRFIEGQDQIWESEAEEVKKYLLDFRKKKPRKRRRRRVSQDSTLAGFSSFWETEVLRKRVKVNQQKPIPEPILELNLYSPPKKTKKYIRKKRKAKPRTIHLNIDELVPQNNIFEKKRPIRKRTKRDPDAPSFTKLRVLIKELLRFDFSVKRKSQLSRKSSSFEKRKKDRKRMEMPGISVISEQPKLKKRKFRKVKKTPYSNITKVLQLENVPKAKILKIKTKVLKKYKKKFKKQIRSYEDLIIGDELQKGLQKNKMKKISSEHKIAAVKAQKKAANKEKKRKLFAKLFSNLSLFVNRNRMKRGGHARRHKHGSDSSSFFSNEVMIPSDDETQIMLREIKSRPKLTDKESVSQLEFDEDIVVSLTDSQQRILAPQRPRRSVRRSFRVPLNLPKIKKVAAPKIQEKSHYQSLKKDMMYIPYRSSGSVRSRRSKRFSTRPSESDPLLNQKQIGKYLAKYFSDSFLPDRKERSRGKQKKDFQSSKRIDGSLRKSVSDSILIGQKGRGRGLKKDKYRKFDNLDNARSFSDSNLTGRKRKARGLKDQERKDKDGTTDKNDFQTGEIDESNKRLGSKTRKSTILETGYQTGDENVSPTELKEFAQTGSNNDPQTGDKSVPLDDKKILPHVGSSIAMNYDPYSGKFYVSWPGDKKSTPKSDPNVPDDFEGEIPPTSENYTPRFGENYTPRFGENYTPQIGDYKTPLTTEENLSRSDDKIASKERTLSRLEKSRQAGNKSVEKNLYGDRDSGRIKINENPIKSASPVNRASRSPKSRYIHHQNEFNYEYLPDLEKLFELEPYSSYEQILKSQGDVPHSRPSEPDRRKFRLEDMETDSRYSYVRNFLKEVIESNPVIDSLADVKGFMAVVAKHSMWDNLQRLLNELLISGLSDEEIRQMLSTKYVDYLKNIMTEMHFAKVEPPRDAMLNVVDIHPGKERQSSHFGRLSTRNIPKPRQSTRLIPFGMRGLNTRLSQENRINPGLYKKLIEQEMNAERLKVESRKLKMNPSFSRLFGSPASSMSLNASMDVALTDELDLKNSEMRYSLNNLKDLMNAHKMKFKALERQKKRMEGVIDQIRSTTQFWRPVDKSMSTYSTRKSRKKSTVNSKKVRKDLRPIEELYYSPRKTARLQRICEDLECSECDCQEDEDTESMVLQKCPRCGVKVPVPAATSPLYITPSSSSSEILSSGSIEACAKNQLVINTLEDLCARCGFIHDREKPCLNLPQTSRKSNLLQRIKDTAPKAPKCPAFCSPRGILKKCRSFDR
ncbi:uncharacterized protein LOC108094729 [Drosophila ficusphila]|uniref:uncharacterized protein LOC108094729 n=1 Tax=Drosophila ficusphila TaxID=30025 RepID=UPI0007E851B6|nr:uncharacterized protein LOC108094729 [Drosophila ficusphila]